MDSTAPVYLSNLVKKHIPVRDLRSATENKFVKAPKFNREDHGGRCLNVLADRMWNRLPSDMRLCSSVSSFKSQLKTHLFCEAF